MVVLCSSSSSSSSSSTNTIIETPDTEVILKEILNSKPTVYILLASMVRFMAGFTIAAWKAPLFLDLFPEQAVSFSVDNALIIAMAGSASTLLGGIAADKLAAAASPPSASSLASRLNIQTNATNSSYSSLPSSSSFPTLNAAQSRLLVPIVGTLLAAPLWALTVYANSFNSASSALLLEYLVAECWFGPAQAALYAALPNPNLRASTQGVFSLLTAVGNLAPVAVGALISTSGLWGFSANTPIRDALLWTVTPAYILSAALFALAAAELGSTEKNLLKS
mmetsp:Transcript_26905/g.43514  ORF Transcript_26905/g.43514 Transcript_26905/m.43514 type:complete len:280 (-) Transcript_26905:209-1048(-)